MRPLVCFLALLVAATGVEECEVLLECETLAARYACQMTPTQCAHANAHVRTYCDEADTLAPQPSVAELSSTRSRNRLIQLIDEIGDSLTVLLEVPFGCTKELFVAYEGAQVRAESYLSEHVECVIEIKGPRIDGKAVCVLPRVECAQERARADRTEQSAVPDGFVIQDKPPSQFAIDAALRMRRQVTSLNCAVIRPFAVAKEYATTVFRKSVVAEEQRKAECHESCGYDEEDL